MKKNQGIIIGVVVLLAIIAGALAYQKNKKPDNAGTSYIGITDATASIADVNDINMQVKGIEVHSATAGWISVASKDMSYNLLALNSSGKTELYAKAYVSAGTYDKVRVALGDVVVKHKTKGDMKATLPSKYVVISSDFKVKEKMNTSVKIDVLADKSLHTTSDGAYVFAPVVNTESRSDAAVSVGNDNVVVSSGGTVDVNANVGVDLSGKSRSDFILKTGSSLKVESDDSGKTKFLLGGEVYEESDEADKESESEKSSSSTSSGVYLEVDDSKKGGYEIENENEKDDDKSSSSVDIDLKGGVKLGQ
jgi:hypothetical protein